MIRKLKSSVRESNAHRSKNSDAVDSGQLKFPEYRGRKRWKKMQEKLIGREKEWFTLSSLVDDGLEEFDNLLKSGPRASAEKRRVRSNENTREWRNEASTRWKEELKDGHGLSSVGEMAKKICEGIALSRRPAEGTVKNSIKGIKPKQDGTSRRKAKR